MSEFAELWVLQICYWNYAQIIFQVGLSISPTFDEQPLRQNPFAKKITNPNFKHIKAAKKKLLHKNAAGKILVKFTPGVLNKDHTVWLDG